MSDYLLTILEVDDMVEVSTALQRMMANGSLGPATLGLYAERVARAQHEKTKAKLQEEGWKSKEEIKAMGFAKAYYLDPLAGAEAIRQDERRKTLIDFRKRLEIERTKQLEESKRKPFHNRKLDAEHQVIWRSYAGGLCDTIKEIDRQLSLLKSGDSPEEKATNPEIGASNVQRPKT